MTNYQVGDKIHIEASVVSITKDGILNIRYPSTTNGELDNEYVRASLHGKNPAIVKHISEPLAVGERVRMPSQDYLGEGTVLFFYEDRALVKFDGQTLPLLPLFENLKRVKP